MPFEIVDIEKYLPQLLGILFRALMGYLRPSAPAVQPVPPSINVQVNPVINISTPYSPEQRAAPVEPRPPRLAPALGHLDPAWPRTSLTRR